jgi:2-oxoglutarate dehydrogenase E2 component (dihydrolipoamide succinyltransferase)
MSVSVSMPQLGESVTEGTVTRWLKKEGERVEADEPLLEVSTDKVDTEIPSPASGILRGIAVDEDETVAVGAQLATIEDSADAGSGDSGGSGGSAPAAQDSAADSGPAPAQASASAGTQEQAAPPASQPEAAPASGPGSWSSQPNYAPPAQPSQQAPAAPPASSSQAPAYAPPPAYGQPSPAYGQQSPAAPAAQVPAQSQPSPQESAPAPSPADGQSANGQSANGQASADQPAGSEENPPSGGSEAPYVTPLVRKLAAEHAVNLEQVAGTGVGGRIRKQDVIEAARVQRAAAPQQAQPEQAPAPAQAAPAQDAPAQGAPAQGAPSAPKAPARPAVVPSSLRGTTQRMSRPRQVIAQRMVESLQTSAQLTTVVEADVTAIARLRDRARADFEAREGVKLSFLPFFALAVLEALKVHPKLNAVIDGDQVTYHDAEHLGIAVDTERGLMVPVIHGAGDLNIGGLARKISDLADRTRSGQVSPDELSGGTFTLTNTGSRGALFDTPIINQPQVGILGTGTVVKRPVVVTDPALGEVIAVRSMVYLALTYDHRLVDGADAARFLVTVKSRLEEGAFEAELGL